MGGNTDVVKGKVKEVTGALTGNDELRAEGKADQAVGKVKKAATKAVEKVKKAVKSVGG
ncbi:MAG: CsbD family protein [Pirellulaceae bacterium]